MQIILNFLNILHQGELLYLWYMLMIS
ncbi:unnamed protein product [Spirodela intermedia]|uniref:Uncharacterized protein n=1 Tax=Spirodela intermedia TaxID=51605 RepID=A0A7I8L277_SPIIN|nr:unnamed protein product [Spirodela intermedia]